MAGQVAKRYARAMLEVAAESGQLEQWGEELKVLADTVEALALGSRLTSSDLDEPARVRAMDLVAERLNLSFPVRSFALVVARRNRIAALPAIAEAYQALLDERLGQARARLTFAREPSNEEVEKVRDVLEKSSGKKIIPTVQTNPELLAGVVVELEGRTYDSSLATILKEIERRLSA